MADTLGRGVIELVADARKLRAGISEAKREIASLGSSQRDASARAAKSIEDYIGKLQTQNAVFGKSTRETQLFRLALRGATDEQLKAANAALRVADANERSVANLATLRRGFIALGAVVGTALAAAPVIFDQLVKKAAGFQDLGEKIGDSASAVSQLSVAAAVGGTSMETIGSAAARLAKNMSGVDEESSDAAAALKSLGLNIDQFKQLSPVEQFREIAKALGEFEDGAAKSAVAQALLGKSGAELLPFFKALGEETEKQAGLTDEQIKLADEYADKQAALVAQLSLHAQALAVEMLPAVNDLIGAFADYLKGITDVGAGSDALGRNTGVRDFADSAIRALAFVVDAVDGVIRIFQVLGKALGGLAAAQALFFSGDFRASLQAGKAALEDIASVLERPTLQNAVEGRIAARATTAASAATQGPKQQLRFTGATKKLKGAADTSAEQAARAQLEFELDQIRRAGDAAEAELERSQRILDARRAANLVTDREFYAAKRTFIDQNAQVQATALEQEIALLQRQTFTGKNAAKEQIDNSRKIAEAQSRLSKIRADAVTNQEVNSIQEAAANERVRQSYLDAAESADAYIDSIRRRNAAEIAGIGQGERFRNQQAGLLEIQDRFLEQRRKLEGELRRGQITRDVFETYLQLAGDAYNEEVSLYQQRTDALRQLESDWMTGATEALANYADEARNVAAQTEEIFANAFQGAEDALTQFLDTGKLDLKSFAASVASDLNRAFVRQAITGPLAESLKNSDLLKGFGIMLGGGKEAAGAAGAAIDATAFTTSVTTAGTTFSASATAAGTALTTATTTAGTSLSATIAASGTTFATTVATAAAQFAATVSAAGAASGGGEGLGSLADFALDSFQSGTDYVPRTGLYQLHQGERVVPAAENAMGGGRPVTINVVQNYAQGQDRKNVQQGTVRALRSANRELARGTSG